MRTVVTEFIRQAELHPENIAVLDIRMRQRCSVCWTRM